MPNASTVSPYSASANYSPLTENFTKQEYVKYLKDASIGNRSECADKYNAFNRFFNHNSPTSGTIAPREGGAATGRMDQVCDFLGYAHWCFALGFVYALREPDDYTRINNGTRCYTYQEFCTANNGALDETKIEDYISSIADEILAYNSEIRGTSKNTATITTEVKQRDGSITRSSGWRVYDTDSWVAERISKPQMVKMLCR